MATRSSGCHILLISTDPDLQAHFKHELKDVSLTISKDVLSLPRSAVKRVFDAVIIETKRGGTELAEIQRAVDPMQTFILAGSRTLLRHASWLLQGLVSGRPSNGQGPFVCLEDYLESKLADFIKVTKHSSARDLHPMLITALERPLITLALKETNGNQIQAAQLLGMNRNTLRKKITELRIPVRREKTRRT